MASKNITALTNLTAPQPTMLLYAALSPFGLTDDRKITANALFATITQNISDISLQFDDGLGTATVAAAGKGKIRYNNTTKTFQASVDGGGYADIGGGGGMAIGGAIAGGATTGSVLFVGAGPVLAQDNANFFWDGTNHRLGIGTTAPTVPLEFSGATQNKINLLLGSTIGFGVQPGRFEMFTTGGAPMFLGQGPGGGMTDWLQVGAAIVRSNLVFGVNCNPQTSFVPLVSFGVVALGGNNVTEFLQSANGASVDQVNWLNIPTNTNTVANQATFFTRSSGAVATGFGSSFTWDLTSTTTNDRNAAKFQVSWTDATDGTRTSALVWQTVVNAGALINRDLTGVSKVLVNNTVTTVQNITVANNTVAGGIVDYSVEVFDGTDVQIQTGSFTYQVTNKGGVFANNTINFPTGYPVTATTAGTLTVTWTITAANPALLQINANSSLTPSAGFPRVTYALRNLTSQATAIQ